MGKYIILTVLALELLGFLFGLFYIIRSSIRRSRKAKAERAALLEQMEREEAEARKTREEREEEARKQRELEEWAVGDPYEDEDGSEGYIEAVDEDLDWDDPVPDEAKLWEQEERYSS